MALLERELFPIHRTKVILLHEVFQAFETVHMSTGGVHRLEQSLKADMADEFIVHFILEVVEMTVQQEVELTTFTVKFTNLGCVFFCYGISHDSQHQALSGHQQGNLSCSSCLTEVLCRRWGWECDSLVPGKGREQVREAQRQLGL